MKKILICLSVCCMFFVIQSGATSLTRVSKNDKKEYKVAPKKETKAAIEQKDKAKSAVTTCFVYIMDYYFTESMDGQIYINFELEVHCYPTISDYTFIIDKTQG